MRTANGPPKADGPPKEAALKMRWPFILTRIAVRTGVAVWRSRYAWLAASMAVATFSVFELTFAGPSVTNGDCADTTMAAVTKNDEETARAAYACLGPEMRVAGEEQFVAGMRQRSMPRGHISRVAAERTSDGGRIVFYTVRGQTTVVGYIVYLNQHGKVVKVE